MKKLVTMFFLLASTALIIAQTPPDVDWIQGFGGSGMEWGYYAEQTSDGGYITIGRMDHGSLNMDAWLIKTDVNGDTLWTKTFGDTYIDEAYCVKQTLDGGYILCGMSTAFGNAGEGWLLKTDANGNQTWSHGFHPTGNGSADWDYFYDVHQLADGNFIVAGTATYSSSISHQGWIVKVNSSGTQIWNKNYGGDYWQRLNAIEPTSDGGFIAAGDIHITYGDTTSQDGWLVKFDANGDTLWTRNFGGSQVDIFRSVQQTSDGGYIIVGEREPYWSSGYRAWLIRTDDNGNMISNNTLGPGALFSIDKTSDGNYAAVGINFSQQTLDDVWVIKINDNCDFLWETIVTPSNLDDIPLSIKQTSDGGYIISGYSNYDGVNATVMLVKMGPDQPAVLTNFTESFDGVTAPALPEGWTALLDVMITNTVAEVKTLEHGGAPSQPNAVFMMNGLDGSNGQLDSTAFVALVSPLVDFGNFGGTVTFWGQGSNPIEVGVMTDPSDASTFTMMEEVALTGDFTEYTAGITTQGTGYIAFKHANINTTQVLFVDQVSFEQVTPVEMTSFTASVKNNKEVELNWKTGTETNNRGFEVQRQVSSKQYGVRSLWEKIGYVAGSGTTTEQRSYSFTDKNVSTGSYSYRLKQIDYDGTYEYSDIVEAEVNMPLQYSLSQNYPNPFNPSTKISFTIPVNSEVTMRIFNTLGEEVRTLINKEMTAGNHEIEFRANELVSGVYFYSLDAKGSDNTDYHSVKKMLLVK